MEIEPVQGPPPVEPEPETPPPESVEQTDTPPEPQEPVSDEDVGTNVDTFA